MTTTFTHQTPEEQITKEVKPMTINDVSFAKQFNGYDRAEVDRYVENLTQAYQTAYDEYNSVCAKYNDLLDKYGALCRQQEQNKSNVVVIAKTLVDTETLAHKIIADAQTEAEKIKAYSLTEAQKLKEDAYVEKAAAKIQAQKLIDDANAEMTGIQERGRELIRSAQAEAALINSQAKRNLDQTNGTIAGAAAKLKELLPPEAPDVKT